MSHPEHPFPTQMMQLPLRDDKPTRCAESSWGAGNACMSGYLARVAEQSYGGMEDFNYEAAHGTLSSCRIGEIRALCT
jgi:hypothetical protein